MRFDLPDGEWVEFVTRLNHAQMRRMRRANADDTFDPFTEGVCAVITGWSVHDVDGHDVPFPERTAEGIPSDALDTLDAETVLLIGQEALKVAGGQPDPKASGATSSSSPPAPRSTSRPSSRTPTFSPITRAGRGSPSSPPPGN